VSAPPSIKPVLPPKAPGKNSDLPVRAASALVMVAVTGGALYLGGIWFTAFVLLIGAGLIFEWARLTQKLPFDAPKRLGFHLGGLLYIGAAIWALFQVHATLGALGTLAIMALVWATDIGAYFAGRTFGGPKIAPAISPSKTWAGLIGGMICATIALWAFKRAGMLMVTDSMQNQYALQIASSTGAVFAVLAQIGDFFESWMKRRAGVKDSGALIPGHGGLFDRLDGLLPVVIAVAIKLWWDLP
jgi:phosphatidate cytidylyltransferase